MRSIRLRALLVPSRSFSPALHPESVLNFYAGSVFRSPQRSLSVERHSQAPAPLSSPLPTEVVFVANVKLTRCWRIFFKGSQGFVRGGGGERERKGLNQRKAVTFLLKAFWGMGVTEEPWPKGQRSLRK